MIGRLRGVLVDRKGNVLVIDCGGVGYVVSVSAHTLAGLPVIDSELILLIHTQAQENKVALFGFGSKDERDLFDLLVTVKNVGPSSAIAILSGGAGPTDIARMIAEERTASLTKLKGIGKKTAEMIVVELREKCELLLATWGAAGVGENANGNAKRGAAAAPLFDEVLAALTQMGWRPAEAQKAVDSLRADQDATLESLLREALRVMAR